MQRGGGGDVREEEGKCLPGDYIGIVFCIIQTSTFLVCPLCFPSSQKPLSFQTPATQAIINVDRSLLICDQAVLLPSFLTPNLLLPVWTVIVRYIAIIKDR